MIQSHKSKRLQLEITYYSSKNWMILFSMGFILSIFALIEDRQILPQTNMALGMLVRSLTILAFLVLMIIHRFANNVFINYRNIFMFISISFIALGISYLQILSEDILYGYYMGILQLQLGFMFYLTNSWKEILALLLTTLAIYYTSLWYDGNMSEGEYFSFTGLAACGIIFFLVSQSYRKLLNELSFALEKLKFSKENEQLFFASAHHELKTPIHTAKLNLEVMEKRFTKKYNLEAKDKEILSDVISPNETY